MIRMALPLFVLFSARGSAQQLMSDEAITVELKAADPVLDGQGPSRSFDFEVDFAGVVFVWAASNDFDPLLQVSDAAGAALLSDDDSGGGTTAFGTVDTRAGLRLKITVAAKSGASVGNFTVHASVAHKSETMISEAEHMQQEVDEIGKLRLAGDLDQARSRAETLAEHVLSLEDATGALLMSRPAWRLINETHALALYETTASLLRSRLAQLERVMPENFRHLQLVRSNLARTLESLGDSASALPLQEKAFDALSKTVGDDDPDLQLIRMNLGGTLGYFHEYDRARALEEKALEVRSRTLSPDHPAVQESRRALAAILYELGDYPGARALQEKEVDVLTRIAPSPLDPELQKARGNLALTIEKLGDLKGARDMKESVLQSLSLTLPPEDLDLQIARDNFAASLILLEDFENARKVLEKVIDVYTESLPDENPDLLDAQENLVIALVGLGELDAARGRMERVLELRSKTLPDDDIRLQMTREDVAEVAYGLRDFDRARDLQEQALRNLARRLPDDHPAVASARRRLAGTLAIQEVGNASAPRRARFASLARDYTAALIRSAQLAILTASSREAEERCSTLFYDVGVSLSFADGMRVFPADLALTRSAFVLSETTRDAKLASARIVRAARGDERYANLHAKLREAGEEIARLVQSGTTPDAFHAAVARRDQAEREMMRLAGELTALATNSFAQFDPDSLGARLSTHQACVAYRRYAHSAIEPGEHPCESTTEEMCAFVMRTGGALARVELGPIEPIEEAVKEWRELLEIPLDRAASPADQDGLSKHVLAAGAALRKLVVDPLQSSLESVDHVVVVLDDVLHAVPIDALPMDGDAGLLGDHFAVEQRLSLRELLMPEGPVTGAQTLVALGGASFGAEPRGPSAKETAVSSLLRGGPWERGFRPLANSGPEARGVAALFEKTFGDQGRSIVLEEQKASRESVTGLAPKARWLHLATHGWFAPASVRSWTDPEPVDRASGFAYRMGSQEQVRGASPMVLCGLALAGANLPANEVGRFPGLVTAEEIASLDLSNCELAVLSACDTNVGARRAGQGVASLQKALHIAGARTVITSLWKVPDEATQELMLDFYRNLWARKMSKSAALWAAKMSIRNSKDGKGASKYTAKDWAAWVLTGDPR